MEPLYLSIEQEDRKKQMNSQDGRRLVCRGHIHVVHLSIYNTSSLSNNGEKEILGKSSDIIIMKRPKKKT